MFTGIIEEVGEVKKIVQAGNSIKLTILCENIINDAINGDSVAVNGICLTITKKEMNCLTFDVMPETMNRSNIGKLKLSDRVNLERAVQLSDRLGGHIVSGHIDGIGTITEIKKDENAIWLTIEVSDNILKYIIHKGSITVDGISLTVSYVDEKCFKISLIPFTREITSIGNKSCGDIVNIECDIIGKYVEKLMFFKEQQENKQSKISIDFLKENGFY
jgi:riboflavin synthase